jgi:hypothetical protein
VVAERALGAAHPRRHAADEGEFGVGEERVRPGAAGQSQAAAGDQRGEEELGHVLGQRRDGGEDQRRGPAEEHRRRQRLAALLGHRVVEAAALADLPVHAGGRRPVHLQAVHAEVVAEAVGVLGVDQRQGDEGAAVLGPGGQHRQAVEADVAAHHLGDRPAAPPPPRADRQRRAGEIARPPQLPRRRRQQRLRRLDQAADQAQRPIAERQLGAPRGAEEVGGQREIGALGVGEQQRRPAARDHPPVDLRRLEPWIDRRLDDGQVAIAAQAVEEGAEVGEAGGGHRGSLSIATRVAAALRGGRPQRVDDGGERNRSTGPGSAGTEAGRYAERHAGCYVDPR